MIVTLGALKLHAQEHARHIVRDFVNRWIGDQVSRVAFGDSAVFRRNIPDDPQLVKAIEMLKHGQTQKDLFALAQANPKPTQ